MASSKNTLSIEASSTSFVTANSTPRKQMPPGSPGTFLSRFGPRSQSSRTTSFASSASVSTLKSLISMEFFLFFLRKISQLHALLEPPRLFIFGEKSHLHDY